MEKIQQNDWLLPSNFLILVYKTLKIAFLNDFFTVGMIHWMKVSFEWTNKLDLMLSNIKSRGSPFNLIPSGLPRLFGFMKRSFFVCLDYETHNLFSLLVCKHQLTSNNMNVWKPILFHENPHFCWLENRGDFNACFHWTGNNQSFDIRQRKHFKQP